MTGFFLKKALYYNQDKPERKPPYWAILYKNEDGDLFYVGGYNPYQHAKRFLKEIRDGRGIANLQKLTLCGPNRYFYDPPYPWVVELL